MTRTRINIVLLLVCLVCTGAASAEWYHVEVIVFENVNSGFDNEDMYKDPGLSPLNSTVKPIYEDPLAAQAGVNSMPDTNTLTAKLLVPYKVLPESSYKLQAVYQQLRQSREYRPQYHIAWQQPGYAGNMARAVHLQQKDRDSVYESTLPVALITDPLPAEFYEPVKLLVDGTVRIRSSAFLYVDIDMMLFRPPVNNAGPINLPVQDGVVETVVEKPAEYVRLTESRRIMLNELQYFDHAKFGVIMQVSRYEPEKPEDEVTTGTDTTQTGTTP